MLVLLHYERMFISPGAIPHPMFKKKSAAVFTTFQDGSSMRKQILEAV